MGWTFPWRWLAGWLLTLSAVGTLAAAASTGFVLIKDGTGLAWRWGAAFHPANPYALATIVLVAARIGLALLPSDRAAGKCAKCGYDWTGNVSGRCPECGEPVHRRV